MADDVGLNTYADPTYSQNGFGQYNMFNDPMGQFSPQDEGVINQIEQGANRGRYAQMASKLPADSPYRNYFDSIASGQNIVGNPNAYNGWGGASNIIDPRSAFSTLTSDAQLGGTQLPDFLRNDAQRVQNFYGSQQSIYAPTGATSGGTTFGAGDGGAAQGLTSGYDPGDWQGRAQAAAQAPGGLFGRGDGPSDTAFPNYRGLADTSPSGTAAPNYRGGGPNMRGEGFGGFPGAYPGDLSSPQDPTNGGLTPYGLTRGGQEPPYLGGQASANSGPAGYAPRGSWLGGAPAPQSAQQTGGPPIVNTPYDPTNDHTGDGMVGPGDQGYIDPIAAQRAIDSMFDPITGRGRGTPAPVVPPQGGWNNQGGDLNNLFDQYGNRGTASGILNPAFAVAPGINVSAYPTTQGQPDNGNMWGNLADQATGFLNPMANGMISGTPTPSAQTAKYATSQGPIGSGGNLADGFADGAGQALQMPTSAVGNQPAGMNALAGTSTSQGFNATPLPAWNGQTSYSSGNPGGYQHNNGLDPGIGGVNNSQNAGNPLGGNGFNAGNTGFVNTGLNQFVSGATQAIQPFANRFQQAVTSPFMSR